MISADPPENPMRIKNQALEKATGWIVSDSHLSWSGESWIFTHRIIDYSGTNQPTN